MGEPRETEQPAPSVLEHDLRAGRAIRLAGDDRRRRCVATNHE